MALFVLSLWLAMGCASKITPITPAAQDSASSQTTASPISAPVASVISPEELAWAKIVKEAQKEGKLTAYSFSFLGDIGLGLQAAFKEKYGITVEIINGPGAQFTERVLTEQRTGNFTGDFFEGGGLLQLGRKSLGLLVSSRDIPVLREKGVWRIDPPTMDNISDAYALVHRFSSLPPYINTDLIKSGQEPKTWKELIEPQWKGRITLADPRLTAGLYTSLLGLQYRNVLPPEFIKALGNQDLKFGSSQREVVTALARGDAALSFGLTEGDTSVFLQGGAHIRALSMAEGNAATPSAISVIKNAPHPNAAKLFVNWILTQEGQTLYGRLASLASVRLDGGDFRHEGARVAAKQIVLTEDDLTKLNKLFEDKYLIDLWKK